MAARVNLDMDVLRTYVTGVTLGSFARAGDRLGRSPSAVSAQLKRLEQQAGAPLLRKAGRKLALTEDGERLFGYAQRLLELNDEAVAAVRGARLGGQLAIGMQEDFAERLLTPVLGAYCRAHPATRVQARVARNAALFEGVSRGTLDLALVWGEGSAAPYRRRLGRTPMRWLAAEGAMDALDPAAELPLVVFEEPCEFRGAAVAALERARRRWRVAFTSPSFAGLMAATAAGLGVCPRTGFGAPAGVRALDARAGLPRLPTLAITLIRAERALSPAAQAFEQALIGTLQPQMEALA